MGRRAKQGFSYFWLDVDWWTDDKVTLLRSKLGSEAVHIWLLLLSELYSVGICYRWGDDEIEAFCARHNFDEPKTKAAVAAMLKYRLFNAKVFEATGFLTSKSIQRRAQDIIKQWRRVVWSTPPDGVWLLDEPFQSYRYADEELIKNKERNKEKEKEEGKGTDLIRTNATQIRTNENLEALKNRSSTNSNEPQKSEGNQGKDKLIPSTLPIPTNGKKSEPISEPRRFPYSDPTPLMTESTHVLSDLCSTNAEEIRTNVEDIFYQAEQELSSVDEEHRELLRKAFDWEVQPDITTGRRPLKKYPGVWIAVHELAHAVSVWESANVADRFKDGLMRVSSAVAQKVGKPFTAEACRRVNPYAWLTGYVLDDAVKKATDQVRLENAEARAK
jgi:hypothetical protein